MNQINHAQQLVAGEVERDCIEKCAIYGIAQSDLVGPSRVHASTFEPHSGKQDYLFSWHTKKPAVQVTGRFYNFDGQRWVKPQVIALNWTGKPIPAVIAAENGNNPDDFEPHYTTVRDDFKSVFEDEEPEINNAFMRAKLSSPKLQGKVTVHVIINTYGQVTAANIDSSELENPEFENTLIYIIKGLEFKSGEFATMERNYTFNFK
ncbi:MAG: AgmX/PglI C-terminal domain-containing protein [Candidatus Saccharibacteria bacterium]|nr:AgmX/PglI C-terminal domain-containing protein [Moraxellaceae bacterium]